MPDISTKATVGIELNTQPVGRKIAELETKLDKLNEKKRQFEAAGDQKGLVKTQKEINKVSRQLNTARTASERCKAALAKLNESSPKELRHTLKQLKADLDHMERGSAAWKAHVEAIKRVKAEIKSVDAELREHEGLLSRINRKVNEWGMSIASAAAAFTGLIFTARQAVQAYADMEAEMANVRKFTGMTADEVDKLNEAFKGMDTRTSREDLNKLAQEAGRQALQSQEDVLGFVNAANQINVALNDLGEGATLTLSKLTDIFGDKDRLGVEQSLLAVGSVINELSQNCTASAPYLAQFAQRLAGVGKQANMTIPQIMGFAAVLDSQGQAVEMSATALSQLIMKLFQDPAKIAKATGMDLQKFNAVLKKDTNEALLMLLERLHSLGDISVLGPVFDAMGTDGARASAVIAALAGNVDMVKRQQIEANKAFKEGTSITKEYNIQNNTVQAQLDKAKKNFHEMAVELGEKLAPAMKYAISGTSAMMRVLSGLVTFVARNKVAILSLLAAIALYTLATKKAAIETALLNTQKKLATLLSNALYAAQALLATGMSLLKGNIHAATQSFKLFSAAIKANPLGLLLGVVPAVISLFSLFSSSTEKATDKTKKLDDATRHLTFMESEHSRSLIKQRAEIQALLKIAEDEGASKEKRRMAIAQLNKICPDYNGYLAQEGDLYRANKKALDDYLVSLERRMRMAYYKDEYEKYLQAEEKARVESIRAHDAANDAIGGNVKDLSYTNDKGEKVVIEGSGIAMAEAIEANRLGVSQNDVKHLNTAVGAASRVVDNAEKNLKQAIASRENFEKIINKAGFSLTDILTIGEPTEPTPAAVSGFVPAIGKSGGKGGDTTRHSDENDDLKKMKAEIEALTAKKNEDLTKLNDQYRKGELASNDDYVDKQYNRTKQYYDDVLAVYKKYGQDQSKDAADVRTKQADDEYKHDKEMIERKKRSLEQQRDADKMAAQMRYYEPDSEIFHNQQALDDELAKIEIEYLEKVRDLTVENTKEREDAELALEKAKQAEILRQRKKLDSDLAAWLYIYSQQGAKQRMDAELAVVDELHKQEKLKTEEVEEAKAAIRKKYRDEVNSKTGTKAPNQDFTDAKDNYNKQLKALEDARAQGLISQEDYESRKWQIVQNYHNKIVELVKGQGNEWATMVTTLVETWKAGFENLGSTLPEKLKSIADMAAAAFAVMNAGIKSYTDYANASRDLEVKKVEQSYDEQIKAAGNNEKKRKALEEQKNKDVAAIKTKYDKRAMAMEMAQAVASTAMAAINAYASAAKVPMIGYLLAPIAASMALAAGAMQIATIKKQHQVQQMGYYEGGFTGRDGNNRREVGVVHANEFVANHQAVANPELLPVLRLIDQAQRNNTVGSLTGEDVSRALGQGAILGDVTAAQQRTAAREDRSMQLVAASMEQQTAAINELNARLADGIESFMVMDGERGFDRSWERYQRMKNNPKR